MLPASSYRAIYSVFESFVCICIRIRYVAIIRSHFAYRFPVLEDDLQAVLWFPIAVALDRYVDTLIARLPARHKRLFSKLYVTPDLTRCFDADVLFVRRSPVTVHVTVIAEDMRLGGF